MVAGGEGSFLLCAEAEASFFVFFCRSSLLQKCSPLKAVVGFHLPPNACIYRQPGERFTIPCSSAGHGSPSHFSSIMLAGYSCVGMGLAGFLGKWGGEREKENSGKQRFKIFFFPASACAGKKENSAKTTLFRVVFFLSFFFF